MNAEERAEKILWDWIKPSIKGDAIIDDDKLLINAIAAQIEEACAEAVKETELRLHYGQINLASVAGKLEGFAAARERAKKIAEFYPQSGNPVNIGPLIASRISAMKAEDE